MEVTDFGEVRPLSQGPGDLLEHQQQPRALKKALKRKSAKPAPILSLEKELGVELPTPPQAKDGESSGEEVRKMGVSQRGRVRRLPAKLTEFQCDVASKPRTSEIPLETSTPVQPKEKKRRLDTSSTPQGPGRRLETAGRLKEPSKKVKHK